MKQIIKLMLVLLLSMVLAVGCNSLESSNPEPPMGDLAYENIEETSQMFQTLFKGDFAQWYEANYKVKGVHSFTEEDMRYLLISAGERTTGGYSLKNLALTGLEQEIKVEMELQVPGKDQIVTQVLSYPHILVKIPDDGRKLSFEGFVEVNKLR